MVRKVRGLRLRWSGEEWGQAAQPRVHSPHQSGGPKPRKAGQGSAPKSTVSWPFPEGTADVLGLQTTAAPGRRLHAKTSPAEAWQPLPLQLLVAPTHRLTGKQSLRARHSLDDTEEDDDHGLSQQEANGSAEDF